MCHAAGTPTGRQRSRKLSPGVRRVLSMAFLLTTLLAAAFGGDDFFLASPGGSLYTGKPVRYHGAASASQRRSGASVRLRRRSAAGCWHGVQHLTESALAAGNQTARAAGALLSQSARCAHARMASAAEAWPGLQQTAVVELKAVGTRLSDAAGRAGHAVGRDLARAASMARAATAAASGTAKRLLTAPLPYASSQRRCFCGPTWHATISLT